MTSKNNELYLIDGMALIYRAHFAFIKNPRFNSKGMNTSAVLGFTNSLLEILNNEHPTHIAVVFDSPGVGVREEVYEEYKANRERQPEDIQVGAAVKVEFEQANDDTFIPYWRVVEE